MFVSPAKIIEILGIMPGMAVADFGSGSGHYVLEAGKKVGKIGRVYAIDIQKEMLSYVRSHAQQMGLSNIETIWTDLEKTEATRLKNDTVDVVIISNILFQADNKDQVVKEAYRILKSGGRAAAIEWDTEQANSSFGPPMNSRISQQAAKDLFSGEGFYFEKEFKPGDHHYGLILKKQ